VFAFRDTTGLGPGSTRVEVAFTDASVDLQGLKPGFADQLGAVVEATGVHYARMNQVHGDVVRRVDTPDHHPGARLEEADALVTTTPGVGLMVRVADCVPVLLADPDAGVVGAVHAGRKGVELDVVTRAVERMRDLGATELRAWVGPHVCGRCYEVPAELRDEVAAAVPATYSETTWGTPALDLGAGVDAQLAAAGVRTEHIGRCTLEDDTLHSYRRDGAASGRMAGLVWIP
jgi:YfiH family protein